MGTSQSHQYTPETHPQVAWGTQTRVSKNKNRNTDLEFTDISGYHNKHHEVFRRNKKEANAYHDL